VNEGAFFYWSNDDAKQGSTYFYRVTIKKDGSTLTLNSDVYNVLPQIDKWVNLVVSKDNLTSTDWNWVFDTPWTEKNVNGTW